MLYIKFDIQDTSAYQDFQKLYGHMVAVRQPDHEFDDDEGPDFDWDNMPQEEVTRSLEILDAFLDEAPQARRYKSLIPDYAHLFMGRYFQGAHQTLETLAIDDMLSLFNYLEFDFEVDMNRLEKLGEASGIVEFSTGNYPFGGLERFFITLKAFGLIPTECFDGFTIAALQWKSAFEYTASELPERTKDYLRQYGNS